MDYDDDPDRALFPWVTTLIIAIAVIFIAALIWR